MIYMPAQRKIIRFKFCSYQYEPLIATIIELKNLIEKCPDIKISVISLPNKRKYYCVNRSPHVNTNSREQFGIEELSQVMEIRFLSEPDLTKFFEILNNFNVPPGVWCEMYSRWCQISSYYNVSLNILE